LDANLGHRLEDTRANALAAIPISDATIRRDLALVFSKDKALSRAALASSTSQ
jgi:hypothetical protein